MLYECSTVALDTETAPEMALEVSSKGTSAESFDFVSVSRQRVRFLYNILSLD